MVIELRIREGVYPNGQPYGVFYLGRHEIGRAQKVVDGWIPTGKRKVLSEVHAAKAMIDSKINRAKLDEAFAKSLLNDLRLHCGGSIPPNKKEG